MKIFAKLMWPILAIFVLLFIVLPLLAGCSANGNWPYEYQRRINEIK